MSQPILKKDTEHMQINLFLYLCNYNKQETDVKNI